MSSLLLFSVGILAGGIGYKYGYRIYRGLKFTWLEKVFYAHSKGGDNHLWLRDIYGELLEVYIEDPINTMYLDDQGAPIYNMSGEIIGEWKEFNEDMRITHCQSIDHRDDLVEAHLRAYVYPESRFARLKYVFRKGYNTYEKEACETFFQLERMYIEEKFPQ